VFWDGHCYGVTRHEAGKLTGYKHNTLSPRFDELEKWGYIKKVPGPGRKGFSGANNVIYILCNLEYEMKAVDLIAEFVNRKQ
jgi:hypothetical protein